MNNSNNPKSRFYNADKLFNEAIDKYLDAGYDIETAQQHLANSIRELRESKNISLRSLARRLKISAGYMSDLERGHRSLGGSILDRIKKELE